MSANAVYFNSVAVSTFRSEIVNIPFRFWLHYLLFCWRKWTMSREDSTTTFMNGTGGFASELTRTYVRVNYHILTGGNQNISIVSCVFTSVVFCWKHYRKVSWMSVNAIYLNSVTMSTFRRWKSVDENGVTKEWNFFALYYKQITAWFLRDIWHKYCSWYFKIVLNITHRSGSWY